MLPYAHVPTTGYACIILSPPSLLLCRGYASAQPCVWLLDPTSCFLGQTLDTSDHVDAGEVMRRLREEYIATEHEDFPVVRGE